MLKDNMLLSSYAYTDNPKIAKYWPVTAKNLYTIQRTE